MRRASSGLSTNKCLALFSFLMRLACSTLSHQTEHKEHVRHGTGRLIGICGHCCLPCFHESSKLRRMMAQQLGVCEVFGRVHEFRSWNGTILKTPLLGLQVIYQTQKEKSTFLTTTELSFWCSQAICLIVTAGSPFFI